MISQHHVPPTPAKVPEKYSHPPLCCPLMLDVWIVNAESNRSVGPSLFRASASQRRTAPSRHAAAPSVPGYSAQRQLRGLVVHSRGARPQLPAGPVAPHTRRLRSARIRSSPRLAPAPAAPCTVLRGWARELHPLMTFLPN